MIRIIGFAFALVISTFAQAAPLAPLHQPDGMITQVREACGTGITWSTVPAYVLPSAATPPGVRLGCVQWVAVALNECPDKFKQGDVNALPPHNIKRRSTTERRITCGFRPSPRRDADARIGSFRCRGRGG